MLKKPRFIVLKRKYKFTANIGSMALKIQLFSFLKTTKLQLLPNNIFDIEIDALKLQQTLKMSMAVEKSKGCGISKKHRYYMKL